MFTIGNEDLKKAPVIGDFILCDTCGERHEIKTLTGEPGDRLPAPKNLCTLQIYRCGKRTYLVGLNKKDIRKGNHEK